ncbi:hypothetical protein BDM02DRAFT_3156019 [Thelephora ganbajun]|uniref:Uncharacterized protein n=1 Tax=Thelephora ganbajun TaxID=370292 RepID=A0ACB6ZF07_THEGA|nr:hypothetical protein BDM02DRAFT_3156019 [Thelephora ganbajun]
MKLLYRHKILSIVTSSLLLTEFILFLFVALSLPIIKSIYLLGVNSHVQPGQPVTSVATKLRFGVWGVCAYSAFNTDRYVDPRGLCYGPSVGYQIPDSILQVTGYPELAKAVLGGLTALLILHPIVAGLSLIGAVTSLFLDSRPMHITSLIFTIVNTFLSSIVLAADLAINIIARDRVPGLTGGNFDVKWGNAVWLVLVGVVLSWAGMILLSIPVCGCCGVGDTYLAWEAKRFKGESSDVLQTTER